MGRADGFIPALKKHYDEAKETLGRHYETAKKRLGDFYDENEEIIDTAARVAAGALGAGALGYGAYRAFKDPRVLQQLAEMQQFVERTAMPATALAANVKHMFTSNPQRSDLNEYPAPGSRAVQRQSAAATPGYSQEALDVQKQIHDDRELEAARSTLGILKNRLNDRLTLQDLTYMSEVAKSKVKELESLGTLLAARPEMMRESLIRELRKFIIEA